MTGMEEQWAEAMAQQRMVSEDSLNRLHEALDSMTSENLAAMTNLFRAMMSDEHLMGYWLGAGHEKLRSRGVCRACGSDHDTEELKALGMEHESVMKVREPEQKFPPQTPVETVPWEQGTLFDQALVDVTDEVGDIEAQLKEYGVEFVDESGIYEGQVRCVNCDTNWVNLIDRMRREPGVKGCPGCQHKAKWG